MREVLPPDLHGLFEATAMRRDPFTTILNTGLAVVKRVPTDDGQDAQYWPEFIAARLLQQSTFACHEVRGFPSEWLAWKDRSPRPFAGYHPARAAALPVRPTTAAVLR